MVAVCAARPYFRGAPIKVMSHSKETAHDFVKDRLNFNLRDWNRHVALQTNTVEQGHDATSCPWIQQGK